MEKIIFPLLLAVVVVAGCAEQTSLNSQVTIKTSLSPDSQVAITVGYNYTLNQGENISVSWTVFGPKGVGKVVSNSGIYYGYESRPGNFSNTTTPEQTGYAYIGEAHNTSLPIAFKASIPARQAGKLYFRAHAVIEGAHYWTPEYVVVVNPVQEQQPSSGLGGVATIEPPPQTNETQQSNETQMPAAYFRIEGDDYILAPNNVTAKKGGNVTIEFYVRTSGIYYGGLQFNSSYFDTGVMKKGESKNVSFIAGSNFTFTSYWPASSVRKADGYVFVEE